MFFRFAIDKFYAPATTLHEQFYISVNQVHPSVIKRIIFQQIDFRG